VELKFERKLLKTVGTRPLIEMSRFLQSNGKGRSAAVPPDGSSFFLQNFFRHEERGNTDRCWIKSAIEEEKGNGRGPRMEHVREETKEKGTGLATRTGVRVRGKFHLKNRRDVRLFRKGKRLGRGMSSLGDVNRES